ncbi:MAG: NADPH:quinone oxidoreductase family protein [Pseudomonadota bacterium]
MTAQMKAVVCETLRDDLSGVVVRDVPVPRPGPGEVLLKVRAASVNYPDILLCQGRYQLKLDPPFTPGMDIAGEVAALGAGVSGFEVGQAVCGGARFGGFADYAVISAAALHAKPERFSFAEAAAYPAAYLTAYVALVCRADLQAGETLLVHGASGGVGLAAVDLGKLLGATVIATGGSADKLAKVKAHGADHTLRVPDGFRQPVKDLTDGRGADVIYDPVGGDVFDESVRCIAFNGRLLVIGFTSGRIATLASNMALIKGFSLMGVRAGEYSRRFPDAGAAAMRQIWAWAESGKTNPRVHDEMPMAKAPRAFQRLLDRDVVGKLVLIP